MSNGQRVTYILNSAPVHNSGQTTGKKRVLVNNVKWTESNLHPKEKSYIKINGQRVTYMLNGLYYFFQSYFLATMLTIIITLCSIIVLSKFGTWVPIMHITQQEKLAYTSCALLVHYGRAQGWTLTCRLRT